MAFFIINNEAFGPFAKHLRRLLASFLNCPTTDSISLHMHTQRETEFMFSHAQNRNFGAYENAIKIGSYSSDVFQTIFNRAAVQHKYNRTKCLFSRDCRNGDTGQGPGPPPSSAVEKRLAHCIRIRAAFLNAVAWETINLYQGERSPVWIELSADGGKNTNQKITLPITPTMVLPSFELKTAKSATHSSPSHDRTTQSILKWLCVYNQQLRNRK